MNDICPECSGNDTFKVTESKSYCADCILLFNVDNIGNKKLCKVILIEKSYSVYYTQLEIDCTPSIFSKHIDNDDDRIMQISYDSYYILRTDFYDDLRIGSKIYLDLNNYEYFWSSKGEKLYYDINHFSEEEIQMLIDAN